jgi:predicted nucleic acid-binding protein
MNRFFLDASGLAKRYSLEHGAERIDRLFDGAPRDRLMCLTLGVAEVVSVLVRRRNGGLLSPAAFVQGMTNLKAEVLDPDDFATLALEDVVILDSLPLIDKHSINSTDAVVLRLCIELAGQLRAGGDGLVLVTSDRRLLKAAQAEALVTFDPEAQTQAELDAPLAS